MYVYLLGILWSLFFSLFPLVIGFPWHIGGGIHVLFQIRPRLIIVSVLMDKSFFGYSFNEAHHASKFEFIKRRSFFSFSLSILCVAWFWNLGFFHIPDYALSFSTNKGNFLCVFTLGWINGNYSVFVVWKITTCWVFGCFFLSTNHDRRFASPLTHTWLIGSGVLPYPCHLVIELKRDGLSFHHSANYYRQLTACGLHLLSP